MTSLYVDLLITADGDFTLGPGLEPMMCDNRVSIAQDIKHAIIESGYATELLAERSPGMRADVLTKIELLVESDDRLVPGTVLITEETNARLHITAETYDFGPVGLGVNYDKTTA